MSRRRTIELEAPGLRYGRWIVLGYGGRSNGKERKILLECECDCGAVKSIHKHDLINGISKSCGCLKHELDLARFRKRAPKESARHTQYLRYKNRAEKAGIEFSISEEDLESVVTRNCWYCGLPPGERRAFNHGAFSEAGYHAHGADRVDNNLGYTMGNIRSCCYMCNRSKNKFSYGDFVSMCVAVARLHGGEWEGVEYV